jgi:hypothetical protein
MDKERKHRCRGRLEIAQAIQAAGLGRIVLNAIAVQVVEQPRQ